MGFDAYLISVEDAMKIRKSTIFLIAFVVAIGLFLVGKVHLNEGVAIHSDDESLGLGKKAEERMEEAYHREEASPPELGHTDNVQLASLNESGDNDKSKFSVLALFETHDKRKASAVIMTESYGAYRYAVGQQVALGYHVSEIRPDHVILERDGVFFRVFLVPLSSDEESLQPTKATPVVSGDLLDETRAERERMRIFSTYDIYPVSDNAPSGYIIGERFPAKMMEESGAKPGDIIVSVNGYNVGDQEGDELALRSFRATMKASVLIQRAEGGSYYFNYPEDADNAE